jgi:hypothetical protein
MYVPTSGQSNYLKELFSNMPLSDANFHVNFLPTVILGAKSNVFEAMFKHSSKEHNQLA